jgi:hypothetical protein
MEIIRNVEPKSSSQLVGSAGRHVRMNAAARLMMRRKDIDGGIIVQAGALMPVKLRAIRDCTSNRFGDA